MIIKKYRTVIKTFNNPAENIFTVDFQALNGFFRYVPGQFLHLALDPYDPSSGWPESRCFSMQSAPESETLRITFAIKGDFTRRMSEELKPGRECYLKLPYGELFTREHSKENTVFIAGGTGITPFLSLMTSDYFTGYTNPALYLGLRSSRFNLYREELEIASKLNPELKVKIYYEDLEGIIDLDSIFTAHGKDSTYFLSGPPAMIATFKNRLLLQGVPKANVRTDEWE